MQALETGYNGLSLLVDLNVDRLLYLATLVTALLAGGYIGTLLTQL